MAEIFTDCCETQVKLEEQELEVDEILVPEKLVPILNQKRVRLKTNGVFSKHERLFAFDESLKETPEDEEIKDFKTLENEDEMDLLDFALDHEEDEDPAWKPPPPKLKVSENSSVKKVEKPRQCDKCKKIFPRRQNYHFHR